MNTRSIVSVGILTCVLVALAIPAGPAAAAPKPTVLATDPADDWGSNAESGLQPVGDFLGQELVGASISMADKKTINFIISVNSLPPWGGMPEISRYNWDFTVDGDAYQLTGGFTEYLRGICNPLHTDSCPPPRDPGPQAFFLRQGPCTVGADCFLLATVNATFDPGAGTITIPVPLEVVKAKPGSKIGPGVSTLGGSVYAAPAALVSYGDLPNDTMTILKSYTIPR